MVKIVAIEVSRVDAVGSLTVAEACRLCAVDMQFFEALVNEGVFSPQQSSDKALLQSADFARLRKASRLFHDLGVNAAGIALAFELMVQIEQSR